MANGFSDGAAAVKKNDKWGYINKKGELIIDYKFDYAYTFYNGYAKVLKEDKYYVIDKTGNYIFPYQIKDILNNIIFVAEPQERNAYRGNFALANQNGEIISKWFTREFRWAQVNDFLRIYQYRKDENYFYNKNGEKINIANSKQIIENHADNIILTNLNDNKKALLNKDTIFITDWYDEIIPQEDKTFRVKKDELWNTINKKGEFLTTWNYQIIDTIENTIDYTIDYTTDYTTDYTIDYTIDYIRVAKNNEKYALIDKENKRMINWIDKPIEFENNIAQVYDQNFWFFIDNKANKCSEDYQDLCDFKNGLARIRQNKKFGFIDSMLNIVIKPIYDYATEFENNKARIEKDFKYNYINTKCEILEKWKWREDAIFIDTMNFHFIFVDNKWAILSQDKQNTISNWYKDDISELYYGIMEIDRENEDDIYMNSQGIIFDELRYKKIVEKDGKYGIINNIGELVVDCKYLKIKTEDVFFKVDSCNKYALIPTSYKENFDFIYDDVGSFNEGLANVEINEKWGVIDTAGNIIIDFIYDYIGSYSEKLFIVRKDEKYGYINIKEKKVIDFIYDEAYSFNNGAAIVGTWENDLYKKKRHVSFIRLHFFAKLCVFTFARLCVKYLIINFSQSFAKKKV